MMIRIFLEIWRNFVLVDLSRLVFTINPFPSPWLFVCQVVVQRWERLQRRAMDRELRLSQNRQDLSKLAADADALLAWLDEAEALQASLRSLPEDIGQLDRVVRQYKVLPHSILSFCALQTWAVVLDTSHFFSTTGGVIEIISSENCNNYEVI